ncbi:MAG: class I SAM-dependent methyltransferase, partial [Planctomycetota bacterium]
VEEAIAYDQMDHSAVNQLFVDDWISATGISAASFESLEDDFFEVLDLGTGTALIPIELARRTEDYDSLRILAVDAAVSMLDLARNNIEVAGLMHRIALDRVDAKSLEYEDDRFQSVISNSIIHHLPDPELSVVEAIRVTRPGGLLFFRDLMRPGSAEEVDRLVETYAGEESEHARRMFGDSLRAALELQEIQSIVQNHGFASD